MNQVEQEREMDVVMERMHNNIGEIKRRIYPILSSTIERCDSGETKSLRCDLLSKLFQLDEELKDLLNSIDI